MRLRYETGVATLVQFIVATGLGFLGGGASIITGCFGHSAGECVSNSLVSLILIILTVVWLGFLLTLGYVAQERRSWRFAGTLIGAEGLSALIYLFDAKHTNSWLSRITNLVGFVLAAWVIWLALQLVRSRGGRIVRAGRPRRRLVSKRS